MFLLHRTLLAKLDHCTTPFGRRLLRGWLARPLLLEESIKQRQAAVRDLKVSCRSMSRLKYTVLFLFSNFISTMPLIHITFYQGVALDAVSRFKRELAGVPDLERALARLHANR